MSTPPPPTTMPPPPDEAVRRRVRGDLDSTLFVEAGAGSGKTRALVERVVALIGSGVAMENIAAITFTEKAAAELRDRIREQLRSAGARDALGSAAEVALHQLDGAAVGTLHSFAQRILSEHPVEAGLPPSVEVLDDIGSQIEFDLRWRDFLDKLLDEPEMGPALLRLEANGVSLRHLRALAVRLDQSWDRLEGLSFAGPDSLERINLRSVRVGLRDLAAAAAMCQCHDDTLRARMAAVESELARLDGARDDLARIEVLKDAIEAAGRRGQGSQRNWGVGESGKANKEAALAALRALAGRRAATPDGRPSICERVLERAAQGALEVVMGRLAAFTLRAAEERRAGGRLEFHDLLVRARALLRHKEHGREVRTALRDRYQRLLIDEFQDTDPIQVEFAALLACDPGAEPVGRPHAAEHRATGQVGGPHMAEDRRSESVPGEEPVGGPHMAGHQAPEPRAAEDRWSESAPEEGRLFFVGDPKQSIYRFRGADIATFLEARSWTEGRPGGRVESLSTNFRSAAPIIEWVNAVFQRLIEPVAGSQPEYTPLQAVRRPPLKGPPVTVLGHREHDVPGRSYAEELRRNEAESVARAVAGVIRQQWEVDDGSPHAPEPRPARLGDIAILIPSRTSLGSLEDALDAAAVPYRAEASSLVYSTREVRDVLMALRAVADPTDELAVVASLRSALYGCGDDDLVHWRIGCRGRFSLLSRQPDDAPADHPVAQGLSHLARLHQAKRWSSPPVLVERLVRERGAFETAVATGRPRDVWRRLRFVIDQARAWADAGGTDLRRYLEWARLQGADSARVTATVLPETDDDSVRILTVHAAKGLEFPIVVLAGMTSNLQSPSRGPSVHFDSSSALVVRVRGGVESENYEKWKPIDEQMDAHERRRLLYVACTRARDHLIVSLHRKAPNKDGKKQNSAAWALTDAGALGADAGALGARPAIDSEVFGTPDSQADPAALLASPDGPQRAPLPDRSSWALERRRSLAKASVPATVSATRLTPAAPGHASHAHTSDSADTGSSIAAGHGERPGSERHYAHDDASELGGGDRGRPGRGGGGAHDTAGRGGGDGGTVDPGLDKDRDDSEAAPWSKGRYGTSVGRAVHGVLQDVDLSTGRGLRALAVRQAASESLNRKVTTVANLARNALNTQVVKEAARGPHWRELFVAAPFGEHLLEGYVDLAYRDPDGRLVVVDWKTDAVDHSESVDAKLARYRLQGAAYTAALEAVTGEEVARMVFVFLDRNGAVEADLPDLRAAVEEARAAIANLSA